MQRGSAFFFSVFMLSGLALPAICQQQNSPQDTGENKKRIFWIIPNFRTAPIPDVYKPIPAREKFKIASQDTFDRGTVALAALFAGESQLTHSNPSFGQGVQGYAHYLGTSYADFAVGNFMTEGVYPVVLHQDPRFFRLGKGSFLTRLGYSAGEVFRTHGDNGRRQINFSELAGNATAVAVSMSYYPDNRNVGDAVSKLGVQIGVDMTSNIIKEFAPDVYRKLSRHRRGSDSE